MFDSSIKNFKNHGYILVGIQTKKIDFYPKIFKLSWCHRSVISVLNFNLVSCFKVDKKSLIDSIAYKDASKVNKSILNVNIYQICFHI